MSGGLMSGWVGVLRGQNIRLEAKVSRHEGEVDGDFEDGVIKAV